MLKALLSHPSVEAGAVFAKLLKMTSSGGDKVETREPFEPILTEWIIYFENFSVEDIPVTNPVLLQSGECAPFNFLNFCCILLPVSVKKPHFTRKNYVVFIMLLIIVSFCF
jgi:hypothetical protein